MIAVLGSALFIAAALLRRRSARGATARRVLAALGVLTLLPSAGESGSWPFVLLAAGAAALAAPLALGLAAAGAVVVALRPEAWASPLAGAIAGLGVAAAADALGATSKDRHTSGHWAALAPLVAGALLVLALLVVDHGAVLSWTFGVGEADARLVLPGVGVALGVAFVATVGGVLLLGVGMAAPAAAALRAGRGVLGVAALVVGVGVSAALAQGLSLGGTHRAAAAWPLALLVAAAAALAVVLAEGLRPGAADGEDSVWRAALATRVAAGLAVAAALVMGIESWWRDGAYASSPTAGAAAAALLGLAALEPEPRLPGIRRALLLAALLGLLFT